MRWCNLICVLLFYLRSKIPQAQWPNPDGLFWIPRLRSGQWWSVKSSMLRGFQSNLRRLIGHHVCYWQPSSIQFRLWSRAVISSSSCLMNFLMLEQDPLPLSNPTDGATLASTLFFSIIKVHSIISSKTSQTFSEQIITNQKRKAQAWEQLESSEQMAQPIHHRFSKWEGRFVPHN